MSSGTGPAAAPWWSLWGPVVICWGLIFFASAQSSPPMPAAVSDKVLHAGAYGALALVTLRATVGGRLAGLRLPAVVAAWLITTLYGATDEFHQRFVPGRSPDLADVAADATGAVVALGLAYAAGIILRSRGAGGRA